MKQAPVIAIDGPAGSGKSTVARSLARRLGLRFLDSGAMYRAVTWKALDEGVDLADEPAVAAVADAMHLEMSCSPEGATVRVDGTDVTEAIRDPELTANVVYIARAPTVRERVSAWQRRIGQDGGIVAEGRDLTTVVFRDADVKFYLDASPDERAKRRALELKAKGLDVDLDRVREEIIERDRTDVERDVAPLRRADDAICIDTTGLTIEQTVAKLVDEVTARTGWQAAD